MAFWPKARCVVLSLLVLSVPAWSYGERREDAAVDIRALTLLDQDGKQTSLRALEGRTVVLHFIFTRCVEACHTQVRNLRAIRAALPADAMARVQFVSLSIDPEQDTPDTLRRYADANGIVDADWRFVTASPDVIERIARHFAVKREALPDGGINHTLAVFLFDASGRMIQRYADPLDTARLVKEISGVSGLSAAPPSR